MVSTTQPFPAIVASSFRLLRRLRCTARRHAGMVGAGAEAGSCRSFATVALACIVSLAAPATNSLAETNLFDLICPAPVQTCTTKTVDDTGSGPTVFPPLDDCPDGYRCVCVPSCPGCMDCAAQVCVREAAKPCQTACDCPPGLGCFEGQCLAGFAPVFCCESGQCPSGEQCQHRDGSADRCQQGCIDEASVWTCPLDLEPKLEGIPTDPGAVTNEITGELRCGADRVCSCIASCPQCDDCVAEVCVPPRTPTPIACENDEQCGEGRHCACAASCPDCTDCAAQMCIPNRCDDATCKDRLARVTRRIRKLLQRSSFCEDVSQCVQVDTTTECATTCGGWVNRMVDEHVTAVIDRLDARICASYLDDGCPVHAASCLPQQPACVDGHCVGLSMQLMQ